MIPRRGPVLDALVVAVFVAGCLFVAATCSGCAWLTGRDVERPQARAAVLAVSQAVQTADEVCAAVALAKSDRPLALRCAEAYTKARASLLATASAVDAWEKSSTRDSVTCALVEAVPHLRTMGEAIRDGGGRVPPLLDDALALVEVLGSCERGTP
jgi:hypothetical protein